MSRAVFKMPSDGAKAELRLKSYPRQEVDDYAKEEDLMSNGGHFYDLGPMKFCDIGGMVFEREGEYWKRIE